MDMHFATGLPTMGTHNHILPPDSLFTSVGAQVKRMSLELGRISASSECQMKLQGNFPERYAVEFINCPFDPVDFGKHFHFDCNSINYFPSLRAVRNS